MSGWVMDSSGQQSSPISEPIQQGKTETLELSMQMKGALIGLASGGMFAAEARAVELLTKCIASTHSGDTWNACIGVVGLPSYAYGVENGLKGDEHRNGRERLAKWSPNIIVPEAPDKEEVRRNVYSLSADELKNLPMNERALMMLKLYSGGTTSEADLYALTRLNVFSSFDASAMAKLGERIREISGDLHSDPNVQDAIQRWGLPVGDDRMLWPNERKDALQTMATLISAKLEMDTPELLLFPGTSETLKGDLIHVDTSNEDFDAMFGSLAHEFGHAFVEQIGQKTLKSLSSEDMDWARRRDILRDPTKATLLALHLSSITFPEVGVSKINYERNATRIRLDEQFANWFQRQLSATNGTSNNVTYVLSDSFYSGGLALMRLAARLLLEKKTDAELSALPIFVQNNLASGILQDDTVQSATQDDLRQVARVYERQGVGLETKRKLLSAARRVNEYIQRENFASKWNDYDFHDRVDLLRHIQEIAEAELRIEFGMHMEKLRDVDYQKEAQSKDFVRAAGTAAAMGFWTMQQSLITLDSGLVPPELFTLWETFHNESILSRKLGRLPNGPRMRLGSLFSREATSISDEY